MKNEKKQPLLVNRCYACDSLCEINMPAIGLSECTKCNKIWGLTSDNKFVELEVFMR